MLKAQLPGQDWPRFSCTPEFDAAAEELLAEQFTGGTSRFAAVQDEE